MKRDVYQRLLAWKESSNRKPLLLRGARQVGKSYILEAFGRQEFDSCLVVNFEQNPLLRRAFETLQPQAILRELELLTDVQVIPGQTLLFLDEIQECPQAIQALRYFKEQVPQLHVVGAGSLLEFVLEDASFRMPVGRVQFMRLYPLTFSEFLEALGSPELRLYLEEVEVRSPPSEAVHDRLLALVRLYSILGGMPEVVRIYRESESLLQCQQVQEDLLVAYRSDFGKYARKTEHSNLQLVLERTPHLLGQWLKYVKIDPEIPSRDLKRAVRNLTYAGLVYPVHASTATRVPLAASVKQNKLKLFLLDIGLALRAAHLDARSFLEEELLLSNRGPMAEQFVAQELLATTHELYSWVRDKPGSSAEIDFVTAVGAKLVPIEVKAGVTGRLKSLQQFLERGGASQGVRVSERPLSREGNILSIPFYLLSQLERLV